MSRMIPLTQGRFAIVDDQDFESISVYKWHYFVCESTSAYAARYERIDRKRFTVLMHREIMGFPSGMDVDHVNGNGIDNRRSNLRVCTHAENLRNKKKPSHNTSGYKGVTQYYKDRYRAVIKAEGRFIHLGVFSGPIEAARAYDAAARKYYGEFANTNFED